MQFKTYIAIFFAVVFFGKFLMMDAKMLNSILATEEIALVNPFCKKKGGATYDDKVAESSSVLVISSEAFCNTPYFIPEVTWPETPKINNFQDYQYLTSSVISPYFSKNYPPPKPLVV